MEGNRFPRGSPKTPFWGGGPPRTGAAGGGKLSIGKCGVVELESSFSQVNINNLSTSLFAEIEYGGLNVSGISKTFTTINVGNEYGQVKLDIHDDASYVLLAEGSYGNISYPESAATMNYKKTGVNGVTLKGRIGTESNPASKVELSTEFGNIIIQ